MIGELCTASEFLANNHHTSSRSTQRKKNTKKKKKNLSRPFGQMRYGGRRRRRTWLFLGWEMQYKRARVPLAFLSAHSLNMGP